MIGQRELDQSHEADITPLAGSHLLAHHPGVAVAEKKDEPAASNPVSAEFRRLLNYIGLRAPQLLQKLYRIVKEC